MKDLRDLKDLTIHDVQPISDEYPTESHACAHLILDVLEQVVSLDWSKEGTCGQGVIREGALLLVRVRPFPHLLAAKTIQVDGMKLSTFDIKLSWY